MLKKTSNELICDYKGRCKRENIAAETFRVNVDHNVAWMSK